VEDLSKVIPKSMPLLEKKGISFRGGERGTWGCIILLTVWNGMLGEDWINLIRIRKGEGGVYVLSKGGKWEILYLDIMKNKLYSYIWTKRKGATK